MQAFNRNTRILFLLMLSALLFSQCKKKTIINENVHYQDIIYEVDTVAVYGTNAEKTKQKSNAQFISTLYGDFYKTAISTSEMNSLEEWISSVGDKQAANELIVCGFTNNPVLEIQDIPTDSEMRTDIEDFIEETYLRFYLRKPTELEKHQLKKIIEDDTDLMPEDIYLAFALSDEYLFY